MCTLPYTHSIEITYAQLYIKYIYTYFAETEIILGAGANFAVLSGISCFNYTIRISKRELYSTH